MLKNQQVKLNYLVFKEKGKIRHKESPFRPIIQDIKDKLSKSGDKLIKKGLHYVEKNERINRTTSKNY